MAIFCRIFGAMFPLPGYLDAILSCCLTAEICSHISLDYLVDSVWVDLSYMLFGIQVNFEMV